MSPFSVDKHDIHFCLYDYLNIERLLKYPRFSEFNREQFDMVLDEGIRFATDKLAPLNLIIDRGGVGYSEGTVTLPKAHVDVYHDYCNAGWVGMNANPEFGGQGLPMVLATAVGEIHVAASLAFMMTPGLGRAAGHVIESFGTEEMKKLYVEKLFSGTWGGTMCLTESGAGTAVGDIKTKARKTSDGYFIEGEKIFISAGEHNMTGNIIHLVLARVEGAPSGIKGVSLFVAPKFLVDTDGTLGAANHIQCGGIEHKMGIHGSPTCTMIFGADGPCRGFLIGEENEGIKYMFQMMNEARIGVGLQGLSTAAASYQEALHYAKERIQGVDVSMMKNPDAPRVPIIRHPDVRRMLLCMKSYSEGMRALIYSTAMSSDIALHSTDEEERTRNQHFLELLTPICKAFCSDYGFRMTEVGMQVLGGYGYTREYPQEQYCRDAKIASIYEGTNGIQALDLLGRKVSSKGGLLFLTYLMQMNDFINEHRDHPTLGTHVLKLERGRDTLTQIVMHFQKIGMEGDVYYPVLCATGFMHLFGTLILGYLLLDQAIVADKKLQSLFQAASIHTDEDKKKFIQDNIDAAFYDGKLHSMRFFVDTQLPHVHAFAEAMLSNNRSPLNIFF
jgi:alkylation response protein AidB-like acyl-CoA dehydrogenase